MDWKLELVVVPISDVDRAKAFYVDKVGFNPDHDYTVSEEIRFVQLTPPGSACSIAIGKGLTPMTPGSTPDEWIERFATLPLMAQPGERWHYNVGSLVLGVLLARVAGRSLPELLSTRVFEPLGMRTTGFSLPLEITSTLPAYYMTNFETGRLEQRDVSTPEEWSRPPAFPSGAGGLVSTADDVLAFGRMLLAGGEYAGERLLSERSVELMTTNHLTPEQIATGGVILGGRGWGFGMGVATEPDADWPVPGRYGWSGGYGTVWFNDPHRQIVALAMTQVSDFLWNGGLADFERLVAAA
jgi:CubicO group peptidase (beta-lactamase class C family)